jgi:hypothetical protein
VNIWRLLFIFSVPDSRPEWECSPLQYVGSLYAKHIGGSIGPTVFIRPGNDSQILASAHLAAPAGIWMKPNFGSRLASCTVSTADFVVEVKGDELVDVNEFSLMPLVERLLVSKRGAQISAFLRDACGIGMANPFGSIVCPMECAK